MNFYDKQTLDFPFKSNKSIKDNRLINRKGKITKKPKAFLNIF